MEMTGHNPATTDLKVKALERVSWIMAEAQKLVSHVIEDLPEPNKEEIISLEEAREKMAESSSWINAILNS